MRFKLVQVLLLVALCGYVSCEGFFTVVGSRLLKHQAKYQVSITSEGYDEPEILEVAIRPAKKDEDNKFEVAKNITLDGKTKIVELDLANQTLGNYNLEVKSFSPTKNFSKYVNVHMNVKKQTVLVQTDKAIYKPSDKIQFRVFVLNADMKPVKKSKVQVFIADGALNRVKQFDNINLSKGFFQNELQLSDSPVLGKWSIHVKPENQDEFKKEFEVAEYTLPKFEMTIDANPDANYKDGKITATVRAKYTFGKIAKGNATVSAEVENLYYWKREPSKEPKLLKYVEVDGKKTIEFDIESELGLKEKNRERTVKLVASFKEELTGRVQNATAKVTIHVQRQKMELEKSSSNIKPGLPFVVTAFVQLYDKNTPVSDPKNPLEFTIKYFYDTFRICQRSKFHGYYQESESFSSDTEKWENFTCREEQSYSNVKPVNLENGLASISIDIPSNTTHISVEAKYLDTEQQLYYISKAESENNQFIQIKKPEEKQKLSENMKIDILSTHELKKLNYQVFAKGGIVLSETIEVPNEKNFLLEITPTIAMVPKADIIVFYMTPDGEIISDTIKVEFENELSNFINIEMSRNQAKPGENLDISVSTHPNSVVGLLGVDQSVLLLKKGNDIEASTIFDELEKYSNIDLYNYQWSRDYNHKTYSDFQSADTVVITNAKDQYSAPRVPMYYPPGVYWGGGFVGLSAISSSAFGGGAPGRPMPSYSFAANRGPEMEYDSPVLTTSGYSPAPVAPKVFEIRKDFPETWIFDTLEFDSQTKNISLSKKVPDTITSWIITGFSIDSTHGLGLTRQPSKFTVFQPFFVTTNLPYSIKRGEVVSIPVLVFNYLDTDQTTEVTLFNKEDEFEFTEVKEDQVKRSKRATESQRTKTLVVKSQSGITVPFMIRPLKVGHITIKVVATSAVAGDGVERQLIVEPEGVTQFKNKAVFIDLRKNSEFKTNIEIAIPPNAVPDSTKIEASAIGDILGTSIENIEKLIKLPYGCGEQNMLNFVPNIVVLDYLTNLNQLTPEIESKTKRFMESGYQRELTYKHDDGSYSAFGKSDKSGSTWLTAFVAKSFQQAAKHIMIDEAIVNEALEFLSKVQTENGSFPEVGHVSHKDMQGGSSNGIALTAYTLITFLENKNAAQKYNSTIDKAVNYIEKNFDALDDNYSLAIASYALQLANHSSKESAFAKLDSKSENKNGMKYWEKEIPKSDENSPWHHQPKSVNVEMSAYALQAFVAAGQDTEAVPIMKWLVTQRNENGGFQSTQDTVVGLQALSKLAAKIHSPNTKVDIVLKNVDDGRLTNLNVNEKNSLILQKHELPPSSRKFEVVAAGRGFGILQLSYKYNLNNTGEFPRFVLNPEVHKNSNKDFLHLIVCTSFVPDEQAEKSNMAVMEVAFPSGYTFDSDSLPELKATRNVKKIETKDGETIVVVYFDDIDETQICPEFKAYRTHSVAKQKPAPVKVYDYYDNSRIATSFYNAPEITLCDICNEAEECKKDCEEEGINVV